MPVSAYSLFGIKVTQETAGARTLWTSFVPLRAENKSPIWRHPPCTRRVENVFTPREGEFKAKNAVWTNFVTSSLICDFKPEPLLCQFSKNVLFLFLKQPPALVISLSLIFLWVPVCTQLNLFFSCSSVSCQFNYETSQRTQKGRKGKFSSPAGYTAPVNVPFFSPSQLL